MNWPRCMLFDSLHKLIDLYAQVLTKVHINYILGKNKDRHIYNINKQYFCYGFLITLKPLIFPFKDFLPKAKPLYIMIRNQFTKQQNDVSGLF